MDYLIITKNGEVKTGPIPDEEHLKLQMDDPENDRGYILPPGVLAWPKLNPVPLQNDIWDRVKKKRDEINAGGITLISGARIQTDPKSMTKIDTLVRSALAAKIKDVSFSTYLTLEDNTQMLVDADSLINIDETICNLFISTQLKSNQFRNLIFNNDDVISLLELDTENGWPTN